MNRLFYCSGCKLRFQEKNFGHGYPERDDAGRPLCPYSHEPMEETTAQTFPEAWVEERVTAPLPDSTAS